MAYRVRMSVRAGIILAVMLVALGFVGSSSASTSSVWWQLTSGSRPTYLHGGSAKDQISEIEAPVNRLGPTEIGAGFALRVAGKELGMFVTEPLAAELGSEFTPLTEANVLDALESVYGKGNVTVVIKEEAQSVKMVVSTRDVDPVEAKGIGLGEPHVKTLSEGRGDGEIVVDAENLGYANAEGGKTPVEISDKLPANLEAVGISGWIAAPQASATIQVPLECQSATLTCSWSGAVPPYEQIEVRIAVVVRSGASTGEVNEASVSGGGSSPDSLKRPITISDAPTPFGVEEYALTHEEAGGAPTTQAGAHPFQQTTTIELNQGPELAPLDSEKLNVLPAAATKDLHFKWPPGLIGNPTPLPQCTLAHFLHHISVEENECAPQTAVGVAAVTVMEPGIIGSARFTVPLFNLEPRHGEPARFGFDVVLANAPVVIDVGVRTGSDYGLTVSTDNITQTAAFLSAKVTVWGVPGDPRHDSQRGWGCLFQAREANFAHAPCNPLEAVHPLPFLSMPTSCTGPLHTSVEGDSWLAPDVTTEINGDPMPALDGCNRLPFSSEIKVTPDGQAASTPTGLNVDVHVPQEASANGTGFASSNIKAIQVKLPEGVVLNPAAADGLQACTETQIGFGGFDELYPLGYPGDKTALFTPDLDNPFCPEASKVGTVKIKTPLLPNALEGAVYLASQEQNPFGSLVAMYIVAEDPVSGTVIKLPGEVNLNPVTGGIVATFDNTPQAAFEDAELHFFGGDRAPLATPDRCGTYTTEASFTPWSGNLPSKSDSSFEVVSGPNGEPCPNPVPFSPSLTAGTTSIQAGGFSPFTMTMSRPDGSQNLQAIKLKMPPGLLGTLATVKLCPEAQANVGTCGPASLIGHTIVSVGVGGDPFSVKGGEVFITEGYEGAPYGLSIVNPAKAGPFDLGKVVVRAKIEVDQLTAELTITTDDTGPYKIPTILDGIPLQIQHVEVSIDRPDFTFNPTNCSPLSIGGDLESSEGSSAAVKVPFQITNCAVLAFKPKLTAKTAGKTSRKIGASLQVKLTYPAGPYDANIARVKVDLPKQLPSRLTTLQKACPAATFEANPAACPSESIVGHATATTPVMPVPLTGPAYFVSHAGEEFPSLIIVLQGYGATVHLVGTTFINNKTNITSSTFKSVPDVPVGTFELTLPQGPYSALAATTNLCTSKLAMPTAFVGQNGVEIHTSTPITPTGCAKHKTTKKKAKSKSKKKASRSNKSKTKK
jgi:hypothetical protein